MGGTGKTTVVRMLRAWLKQKSFTTAYFNAWQEDYVSDPLIPMVAAIDEIKLDRGETANFRSTWVRSKKLVSIVIKACSFVCGSEMVTIGALDLEQVQKEITASAASEATNDLVEWFKEEKQSLEKFRTELEKAVEAIQENETIRPLVFFIDELDRCRPSFAIELLERVKHLFDVKNIVFVLSIDKKQLEAITAAVYGERIDAPEYLRRFIDLDFSLPMIHTEDYVRQLISNYGFSAFFATREKYAELRYD